MKTQLRNSLKAAISDGDLRCRFEFALDIVAVTAGSDDTDLTVPTRFGVDLLCLDLGLVPFTSQELLPAFDADWIFHVI